MKIIGDKGTMCRANLLDVVIRADMKDEIKEIKDLKGRKIVLFLQSANEEYADRLLKAGGLTKDDVELGLTALEPAIWSPPLLTVRPMRPC
ncbi:MAG: ABC transporter substrate-binding protein [Anaerolineae bacterium]